MTLMVRSVCLFSLGAMTVIFSLAASVAAEPATETNKKLVRDFYELAFNQHKPTEAARKYFGERYIQHNPHVPNGAEAFYGHFEGVFKEHPKSHVDIKRILAEGDLVVLHVHSKLDEKDRGLAIVDIFRVENGKIVEHWDVIQPVPQKAANDNTMF